MEEILNTENHTKECTQCGVSMDVSGKFCRSCGVKQAPLDGRTLEDDWSLLKQAAFFFGINIVVCAAVNFTDKFHTLFWDIFVEITLWATAIIFFAINWRSNKHLLKWPDFSLQKLSAYCGVAIAGAFLVHYSVGWLNHTMFPREEDYFAFYKGNLLASVILVFFMAITPALFEELGFRGYLLQTLLKVSDRQQAVYVTSFLFAIIHMSFISLFWLIPFALLLAVVRIKEGTLWYGIFMHFCFNATACLFMLI